MSSEEACASLLEALDAQRTDILKSLLDHLVSGKAEGVSVAEVVDPHGYKVISIICRSSPATAAQQGVSFTRQWKWVKETPCEHFFLLGQILASRTRQERRQYR